MAELKLIGAVGVKVRPDTSGFRRDTKRGVERELSTYDPKVKVGVDVDKARASRELKTLRQMVRDADTKIQFGFDAGRGTAVSRFVNGLTADMRSLGREVDRVGKQRLRFPGFDDGALARTTRATKELKTQAQSLIDLNKKFKLEVKADGFQDAQRVIDRLSGSQQRLGRISEIEGTKLARQASNLANQWRRVDDAQKGVVQNVLQTRDNLRIGKLHEEQLANMSASLASIGEQIKRTATNDFYNRMFGEPGRSVADLFANLSEADLQRAEREADELKRTYEQRLKNIQAQIDVEPVGIALAAAQLSYASRPRTVNFFVRVNEKSLIVAEGLLKSLAGLNVLESTGRLLESIFTKFDTFTLKAGGLGAAVGGVVDTLAYMTTSLLTIGEGMVRSIGLFALAPTALATIAGTVLINVAAFKNFKSAVDGSEEALAALPPAARDAALALQGTWESIQVPVQNSYWASMGTSVQDFVTNFLPPIRYGMTEAAGYIGEFANIFLTTMSDMAKNDALKPTMDNFATMFKNATGAAKPFAEAFNTLGIRGAEFLPRFGTWLTDISTGFRDWIKEADEAGKITSWIEGGVQSLKDMSAVGASTVDIFRALTRAASDGGSGGLGQFRTNMRGIADMMLAEPFQSRMARIFDGAREGASKLNTGVKDLAGAFGEASDFTGDLLEVLGEIGGVSLSTLARTVSNIRFQAGVLESFQGMRDLIRDLAPAAGNLGDIIGGLGGVAAEAFRGLAPIFNTVTGILADTVTVLADDLERIVPKLTGFVSSVLTSLTGPIGLMTIAVEGMLTVFNVLPGPIGDAAVALGLFLLMRNQFAGFFRAIDGSRAFSSLKTEWATQQALAGKTVDTMGRYPGAIRYSMQRASTHVAGVSNTLRDLNGAARFGADGLSGFHDRMSRGGATIAGYTTLIGTTAAGGVRGALRGITSVLGGPWGVALAAGAAAIGIFAKAQGDAKARVESLTASLDEQTGQATAATLGQIAKSWTDIDKSGDMWANFTRGAAAANETAEKLGLNMGEVTRAIAEGGPAYDSLVGNLKAIADFKDAAAQTTKDNIPSKDMDSLRVAAEKATKAMGTNLEAIKGVNDADLEHIIGNIQRSEAEASLARAAFEGLGEATGKTSLEAQVMADAMQSISDRTSDAAGKINAIRTSLDLLNGGSLSAQEAEFAAANALEQAVERAGQLKEAVGQAGDNLTGVNGLLASTTTAGRELYDAMSSAADGILIEAQAAYDAAILAGETPKQASEAARAIVDGNVDALNRIAEAAGVEVGTLEAQWSTFFGKDWQLDATFSATADKFLAAEKIARDSGIAFDAEEFTAFLNANGDPATVSLEQVRAHMVEVLAREYVATIQAIPTPALTAIKQVGDNARLMTNADYIAELEALDKTYPGISASVGSIAKMTGGNYAAAIRAINDTQGGIRNANFNLDNIPDELVQILSQYAGLPPAPYIPPMIARIIPKYDSFAEQYRFPGSKNGSIWDGKSNPYAGRFGMQPIKAFADGGIETPGTAKIYSPSSTYRIFAEPETGGEAYIPLAASKRDRSLQIWEETGRLLGASQYANGGIDGQPSAGSAPTFNITNHYPVSEPTSTTVNKALAYAGYPDLS